METEAKTTIRTAVITLLFAALLLSSAPLKIANAATAFSDVPERHWAYSYIEEAVSEGFINGIGDGRFAPDDNITYGQFASMMTKAFYMDEFGKYTGSTSPWYLPYCEVCDTVGIFDNTMVTSYGNWSQADRDVNRYDMAMMMYNAMLDQGYTVSESDIAAQKSKIADLRTFPSTYVDAVAALMHLGCINGIDTQGTFSGLSNMNRAQAATAMVRMYNSVTGKQLPSGQGSSTPATKPDPTPEYSDTGFHIKDYFYLGNGEYVETMMIRVNKATPPYRAGYLTNGKPITEANIMEMLAEIEENFPQGTEWATGEKYYYHNTKLYGTGIIPGGCASWGAAVSDALFGEDAPIMEHQNFESIKPGDVIWITNQKRSGGHVSVVTGYPDEDGYYNGCSGNSQVNGHRQIMWNEERKLERIAGAGADYARNTWVYSRY